MANGNFCYSCMHFNLPVHNADNRDEKEEQSNVDL